LGEADGAPRGHSAGRPHGARRLHRGCTASAAAIDIGQINLVDGRHIQIGEARNREEARFLDAVRAAGCGWFTTVVGPGSDAAHAHHLHFDALPRGATGRSRWCE
jgi:hypothetical protein